MRPHLRRLPGRRLWRPSAEECLSGVNRSFSVRVRVGKDQAQAKAKGRANLPQDKTGRRCDPENAVGRIRRAPGRRVRVQHLVQVEEV